MKKTLLALAMLASTAASAQITLEQTYNLTRPADGSEFIRPYKMSTGEWKYVKFNTVSRQITVYSANQSVEKQFTAPAPPTGYSYPRVSFMSDKLFNLDANLEYALSYYKQEGNSYGVPLSFVYSETGALLVRIDSADVETIYNTPTGAKMLVEKSWQGTKGRTLVYGLAGTLTAVKPVNSGESAPQAFPNPTTGQITLPYEVKRGQVAELILLDSAGRQVGQYKVDSTFDHLRLDAATLRAGVYSYRIVSADGSTSVSRRFVVQK